MTIIIVIVILLLLLLLLYSTSQYPNITIHRGDMWAEKCFNCVFKQIKKDLVTFSKQSDFKVNNNNNYYYYNYNNYYYHKY